MRVTILPKAPRAAVSMMAKGIIVTCAFEVFLIFTTQLYMFLQI